MPDSVDFVVVSLRRLLGDPEHKLHTPRLPVSFRGGGVRSLMGNDGGSAPKDWMVFMSGVVALVIHIP